jgi:short-subunit dehydrogenase
MTYRSIVISGASRGLGAGLARRFAAPGVTLGLTGRDAAALTAVAAECEAAGATVRTAVQDVRDRAAMAALMERWDDAVPVDLAIANAGIAAGTARDRRPEPWEAAVAQVEVNLLGAMHLAGPLIPRMMARRAGRIGLVASVAAFRAMPDFPGYAASKAGLRAWGEGLRPALRRHGVGVTVITPGFFPSAMGERFHGPKLLQVPLETAVARVHRALARGQARCVFPWPLAALLRGLDLLPAPIADRAVRLYRFTIGGD